MQFRLIVLSSTIYKASLKIKLYVSHEENNLNTVKQWAKELYHLQATTYTLFIKGYPIETA